MNDDELMGRVAQGDEESFRTLVERWQQPVFSFLERMVGSSEEALDLSQDVLIKVYRQAGRYTASGRFRAWIFRMAGNLARSHLRRRKILRWVPFDPRRHERAAAGAGPGAQYEQEDLRQRVRAAIGRLPARQRQALLMRRYEGMSTQEIALSLGTTVPAVESLLQRAMRKLRSELGREEQG